MLLCRGERCLYSDVYSIGVLPLQYSILERRALPSQALTSESGGMFQPTALALALYSKLLNCATLNCSLKFVALYGTTIFCRLI